MIEECWRLLGHDGKMMACAIYDVGGAAVELRWSRGDDSVRVQRFSEPAVARHFAAGWRAIARANGLADIDE